MPYNPSLSSRAIIGRFYRRLEGAFDASWASLLGMLFPSNQASETYNWLGQVPQMREWGTGRLIKQLRSDGLTIVNKVFEATLRIDIDDKRRDKTGQINARIDELARRAAQHWETLLSTLIANGDGNTSGLAYDGQFFFDTDHSEGASGTLLNDLAAAQVASLNVGTATAPSPAEMAQAVADVIGYMLGWLDDQGEPINGDARSFAVMCPTATIWSAALAAATKPTVLTAVGVSTPNPLDTAGLSVKAIYNPRLAANTTNFWVFRTDGTIRPFILQEEEGVKMDAIAEGSELEINSRQHQYGVTALRNAGYGMWQSAAQCTLS